MKQIRILFFVSLACLVALAIFFIMKLEGQKSEKINRNAPTVNPTQKLLTKGSIPYWDQDRALSSFKKYANTFDYINLFWYYLGDTGIIEKYKDAFEDRGIIDFAHANKVRVLAVITNLADKKGATWDSDLVIKVIDDKNRRSEHISNIVKKIDELGLDGVTIDYEEVDGQAKGAFSIFIKELALVLHKNAKILAVALHPKIDDFGNGAFQDWEALAQDADQLNIMAYGEHWDESSAGPIASTPWVGKIIEYTKRLNINPQKFILGIPLYGYDWNKDHEEAAGGLTYQDIQNLLIKFNVDEQWNNELASPYFLYNDSDDTHEVWFENSKSVSAKIELAKKAGFGGITFWRLGGEDSNIWEELEKVKR